MNELEDEVMRLRSRLAEAEAENLELARLSGMGSEREARLLAKLAEVEAREARLASALEILIADCRAVAPGEPPERMIPVQHPASSVRQSRAALSASPSEALDAVREAQRAIRFWNLHEKGDWLADAYDALARIFGDSHDDK